MTGWQIALLIVVIVVAWLGFWVAIVSMIGRLGGWRTLAESYPAERIAPGAIAAAIESTAQDGRDPTLPQHTFGMQSLVLCRWVSYNGGVRFTIERDGLRLSILFVFRPGHRDIFLPWSQFNVSDTTRLGMKAVRIETHRVPEVPITISTKLAQRLREAAGNRWPAK